ncbi:uncharacterized protein LOC125232671 [Leguminivora glycinivorella]|uniref:uncharacterized protein LOC125232671 n=1 Tax=Leguminivora glycinivorella TaxID=1035111 RepID=UPI00200D176C|nr:uncharacterized protein LOC125232671 [Leguminivora glycinivorella]
MKIPLLIYWALSWLLDLKYNVVLSADRTPVYLYMTPFPRRKPLNRSSITPSSTPSTATYYNPNPGYDAYWTDGHWIFGTSTTRPSSTTSTRTRILVCRKPCPIEYRDMGRVCAHKAPFIDDRGIVENNGPASPFPSDKMKIHFNTFQTYCHFLQAQCLLEERAKGWNDMIWVFIHFGECLDDEEVVLNLDNDKVVVDRKKKVMEQYNQTISNLTTT